MYRIHYLDDLILRFLLSSLLSYSITTRENRQELLLCPLTGVLIGRRFDQVAQKRITKLLTLLRTDAVTMNKGKSVILREINCSLVRLNGDLLFVSPELACRTLRPYRIPAASFAPPLGDTNIFTRIIGFPNSRISAKRNPAV